MSKKRAFASKCIFLRVETARSRCGSKKPVNDMPKSKCVVARRLAV